MLHSSCSSSGEIRQRQPSRKLLLTLVAHVDNLCANLIFSSKNFNIHPTFNSSLDFVCSSNLIIFFPFSCNAGSLQDKETATQSYCQQWTIQNAQGAADEKSKEHGKYSILNCILFYTHTFFKRVFFLDSSMSHV